MRIQLPIAWASMLSRPAGNASRKRGEQSFLCRLVGEVGGELRLPLVLGIVAVIAGMDRHGGGVADGVGQGMGLHAEGERAMRR